MKNEPKRKNQKSVSIYPNSVVGKNRAFVLWGWVQISRQREDSVVGKIPL
jgi:hypothetical protein